MLGPDHPDTLGSVNNLAGLYQATGRYEVGPSRSISARWRPSERVLGPDHPDTLISVNNLAALYEATGRYDAAEPLYQRALEARERVLGPDHPVMGHARFGEQSGAGSMTPPAGMRRPSRSISARWRPASACSVPTTPTRSVR